MNLEKYKNHLFQKIKNQLCKWFESSESLKVENAEVFRFLHSIKGTAGTIQLDGLMQVSQQLLEQMDENSNKIWGKEDLQNYLFHLVELVYDYEHFEEGTKKELPIKESNAPLIQIIDDDISMLIILKEVLEQQGWMVITSNSPEKAASQYYEMQPDLLILDINLPKKNGFRLLEDIQTHNEKYFVPKIIISVQKDMKTRIKAYETGADDFIEKPIEMDLFLAKIRRHLQRKKIFDQSVLIDELTQVYNRRFFEESMKRSFHDFKRNSQPFTICIADIDHFKSINDTYGHLTGDRVLADFAGFLKDHVRSSDVVYRYGGEEFVIYFPGTSSLEAKNRITELISIFAGKVFYYKDIPFSITFSAGVYTVVDETETPKSVFKAADLLLYEAKHNGRARVESAVSVNSNYSKKTIYVSVVDDDIIIRTMLSQALKTMDINGTSLNVAVYENGVSFLDSARSREDADHFLILDGIMPEMDGLEVLQKVKQGSNAQRYTILMLTGRKSEHDIARALSLGADDYATKPFSIAELGARILRLLKRMNDR
ncbi:diguanylate cyclase (GGDEF) domain-containing protein [Bacillus sp. OV322]|uniref:diguanylate cyclase n=1 Tax=Bacillus sp. OV322 TaxID=1882764 RepID=UPI0008E4B30B|nr:diguanylate cyclase [Bacillus sp. OV322]SFC78310.1 diguanylate cyclase (GGDEF) domain-containing protein [Bacillus sp. OV322]